MVSPRAFCMALCVRVAKLIMHAGNWPVSTIRAAAALLEIGTQCHDAPLHESQSASRKVRGRAHTDAAEVVPRSELLCTLRPQAVLNSTLDVVRRLCEASANILKLFPVEDRLVRP